MFDVFSPGFAGTISVTNATAATAAAELPSGAETIALTNTSSTARVHVFVTPYDGATAPTGTAPTLTNGMPVLPSQQIRIKVGKGPKVIRTIATAADGAILITPGNGG